MLIGWESIVIFIFMILLAGISQMFKINLIQFHFRFESWACVSVSGHCLFFVLSTYYLINQLSVKMSILHV